MQKQYGSITGYMIKSRSHSCLVRLPPHSDVATRGSAEKLFGGFPKFETRSQKPETRDPKSGTRNPKPEIRYPKPGTQNPKPETSNPEPETQNMELETPKSGTRHPKAIEQSVFKVLRGQLGSRQTIREINLNPQFDPLDPMTQTFRISDIIRTLGTKWTLCQWTFHSSYGRQYRRWIGDFTRIM